MCFSIKKAFPLNNPKPKMVLIFPFTSPAPSLKLWSTQLLRRMLSQKF